MSNYEEKIANIKETEKLLLEMAKQTIITQNKIISYNNKDLIKMLNYDADMVKKYEATVKAQQLIEELANEIAETNDIDKIIELRKKLNYYINKVKKEIKNRNISEEEYNAYYNNTATLRKNISKYLRFLKRENNLKEITNLNNNFDNLNEEERKNLKRLIKLESSYIKRNNSENVSKPSDTSEIIENNEVKVSEEPVRVETNAIESENQLSLNEMFKKMKEQENAGKHEKKDNKFVSMSETLKQMDDSKPGKHEKKDNMFASISEALKQIDDSKEEKINSVGKHEKKSLSIRGTVRNVKVFDDLDKYLDYKVKSYENRYNLVRKNRYTGNFGQNLIKFAENLSPKIIGHNKRIIKKMQMEVYREPKDVFKGFIAYNAKDNSIIENIKDVFRNSFLSYEEGTYSEEHRNCIEWIKAFCRERNVVIDHSEMIIDHGEISM